MLYPGRDIVADTGWLWLSEHGASAGSVLFLSPRATGSNTASTLAPITIANAACLPTTGLLLLLQVSLQLERSHYRKGSTAITQTYTEYTSYPIYIIYNIVRQSCFHKWRLGITKL